MLKEGARSGERLWCHSPKGRVQWGWRAAWLWNGPYWERGRELHQGFGAVETHTAKAKLSLGGANTHFTINHTLTLWSLVFHVNFLFSLS